MIPQGLAGVETQLWLWLIAMIRPGAAFIAAPVFGASECRACVASASSGAASCASAREGASAESAGSATKSAAIVRAQRIGARK